METTGDGRSILADRPVVCPVGLCRLLVFCEWGISVVVLMLLNVLAGILTVIGRVLVSAGGLALVGVRMVPRR